MFKHRLKANPLFALGFLSVLFFFREIHWGWFYFSYFIFYSLGVGLGYHRILCHRVPYQMWFSRLAIYIGSLAHLGSLKGSILWHLNHHAHADTEHDTQKGYLNALMPRVDQLQIKLSNLRHHLAWVDRDPVLNLINRFYYLCFFGFYGLITLFFGWKICLFYFVGPASLSLIVHAYSAIWIHRHGYRNFARSDRSQNSWMLLPLLFGENWHNNHHDNPQRVNLKVRPFEWDIIYVISRPFRP